MSMWARGTRTYVNYGSAILVHGQQLAYLNVTIIDTVTSHLLSDITNIDSRKQSE